MLKVKIILENRADDEYTNIEREYTNIGSISVDENDILILSDTDSYIVDEIYYYDIEYLECKLWSN